MSLEDIVKRNRRALGEPEVPDLLVPTMEETVSRRCCPWCRGDVQFAGVERLSARGGRLAQYRCLPCMRTFGVPSPNTLAVALLASLLLLAFSLLCLTSTLAIADGDRIPVAIGLAALGIPAFAWSIAAARRAARSATDR